MARADKGPPLVLAHRGGAPDYDDNTADAFRSALENEADVIECDLQRSRDGVIVVLHDETVYGVPVTDLTLDELRALAPAMLTLDEMLEILLELDPDARFVLDLKDRGIDRHLLPWLSKPEMRRRSLVTSKFSPGLRRLGLRYPDLRLGLSRGASLTWVRNDCLRRWWAALLRPIFLTVGVTQMRWGRCRYAAFQHYLLDKPTIDRLHELGFRIDAWTVDDASRAAELARNGVDLITTNDAGRMPEWLAPDSLDEASFD